VRNHCTIRFEICPMKNKSTKMEKTTSDYLINEVNKNEVLSTINKNHVDFLLSLHRQVESDEIKIAIENTILVLKEKEEHLKKVYKIF